MRPWGVISMDGRCFAKVETPLKGIYDEYEKKWVPTLIELRYSKADEDGPSLL